MSLQVIFYDFKIKYLKEKFNVFPKLLSKNPDLNFSKEELDDFNNVIVLPSSLFLLNDDLGAKVVQAQKVSEMYTDLQNSAL